MNGRIFVEFLAFVDEQFSPSMTETLIDATEPGSGAAYSSVGDYPSAELLAMVKELAGRADLPPADLCVRFGDFLFHRLYEAHADILSNLTDLPSFLMRLDDTIHAEVRKLHASAEPPTIAVQMESRGTIRVRYCSRRPLADVAEGLLRGCIAHFGDGYTLQRQDPSDGNAHEAEFILLRRGGSPS